MDERLQLEKTTVCGAVTGEAAEHEQFFCPMCGRSCAVEQGPEPLILQGKRSEIEYSEPRCHCRSCRRDFFPLAGSLQRPVRETVTPAVLQKVVWAGANLGSSPQAVEALRELSGIELSAKQVRRMTEQVGQDRHDERQQQVADFKDKPLMDRLESPADVESP